MNLSELLQDTPDVRTAMIKLNQPDLAPRLNTDQLPNLAKHLGHFFGSQGMTGYIVGGAVRDTLLGRLSKDLDVTIEGNVETFFVAHKLSTEIGGRAVPIIKNHKTTRLMLTAEDSLLNVDISNAANGIHTDLSKRDFTIDAMAIDLNSIMTEPWATLIDPFGGAADISSGIIKATAPEVFEDDPTRLLRAPRLAAQLGFRIDNQTAKTIREQAHLVQSVSGEQVRDELLKILGEPNAAQSIRLLDRLGLLTSIFPELEKARNITQPKEHYWKVLDHSIETVDKIELLTQRRIDANNVVSVTPWSAETSSHFANEAGDGHTRLTLLKLIGLLHDIGKPNTKTVEASGKIRFLGHHTLGAEMTEKILDRLRLNRKSIDIAVKVVEHHLRPSQMSHGANLPSPKAVYRYCRDLGDAALDTLYLNLSDYLAARGPDLNQADWQAHCNKIGHVLASRNDQKKELSEPKLISGTGIMNAFSLEPGPQIGHLIELVREAQASGEVSTTDEAFELVRAILNSGDACA